MTADDSTRGGAPQKAIALFYDGQRAPRVSAIGEDAVAEEIVRIAREAGVPLYEDAALLRSLAGLELGDAIPELLYRAIAEVIAFAYLVRGRTPAGFRPDEPKPSPPSDAE